MNVLHRVISLDTASKRRYDINREFQYQGIDFSFHDAIKGSELDLRKYHSLESPYHRKLSAGEVGCYLSHISLLKSFLASSGDYLVVYEDDVRLTSDYGNKVESILSKLKEDCFDLLLLGYRNDYLSFWGGYRSDEVKLKRFCDYGWGAHAYVVTKKSAEKILAHFSSPTLPYDCVTGGYVNNYNEWSDVSLKIYATPTKLVELHDVNSETSTIEDREDLSAKSKSKFLGLIVRIIKTIKPLSGYHYE
jgi:glycosyl transferase family 25